jgi:predicted RNase H-like HicB family nuclease
MHAELGASTRSERVMPVNDYPVIIEALTDADGGGFLATVPDLPGCMSDGETREEAARNIGDAIACWIEEARALGRAVPAPRVALRIA